MDKPVTLEALSAVDKKAEKEAKKAAAKAKLEAKKAAKGSGDTTDRKAKPSAAADEPLDISDVVSGSLGAVSLTKEYALPRHLRALPLHMRSAPCSGG